MASLTIQWTPEMDKTLHQKYHEENWPVEDIAIILGVKKKQVQNRAYKLQIKRQNGKTRRPSQWTPEQVTHIIREYVENNTPVYQIAEQLGRDEEKVWNKITHLQLKRQPNYQRNPRRKPQQDLDGRYLHQEPGKPKPHIPIPTHWNGNGTIQINLHNLVEAWNKDLDYTYTDLPEGVTVDILDSKIQSGEWRLL